MADQTKNAGNIGDVIKHAIVPAATEEFSRVHPGGWLYVETHAGFYHYPKPDAWKGEQKRSVGVIEQSGRVAELGPYGRVLADDASAGDVSLKAIYGRDVGAEQVASFRRRSSRIHVSQDDGYQVGAGLPGVPRLILVDPFWDDKGELKRVRQLLSEEPSVMVWYPLSKRSAAFRSWQRDSRLCSIELEFAFHDSTNGWAEQDQKGAGLTFQGIPPAAFDRAVEVARVLQSIFAGRVVSYEGSDRDVSLELRVFQGRLKP
jgi:23S rRNA A2030 N6-methylase RlmJ